MSELDKLTTYQRVSKVMEGWDDVVRETTVYPQRGTVLGISELDDAVILTYATKDDEEGQEPRFIWLDVEGETYCALIEVLARRLSRNGTTMDIKDLPT